MRAVWGGRSGAAGHLHARRGWPLAAGALVAGLAQAGSIALPVTGAPAWWLQALSLAVLCGLIGRTASPRAALGVGWLFATAWLSGTFWWLYISMHDYGGLAAPLTALAVVGLAAFLGTYYAIACMLYKAFAQGPPAVCAIFFAALWLLAELLRAGWFTGFPWGAGGYAHLDGMAWWLVPWIGVNGVGAVASAAAAGFVAGMAQRRWVQAALAAAALVLASAWPAPAWAPDAPEQVDGGGDGTLSVALLQGNIPQDQKFQPGTGVPLALQWYAEQLRDARAELVVTPETAVPVLPYHLPPGYEAALRARFAAGGQAALVGMPLGSAGEGYSNSIVAYAPAATSAYRYDKHHLVPFGEFIPPLFRWFTNLMDIPLGDFRRGALDQPSFAWKGQRIAPNICYEDLFGDELALRFADPSQAPTILVNVSNIGWFGDTVAIDQHLGISRMRALEFDRPVIRATNTGATVVIDRHGRVTASLAPFTRGVLEATVAGRGLSGARDWDLTPYARWASRFGNRPLWGFGLTVVALHLLVALRRRHRVKVSAAETPSVL